MFRVFGLLCILNSFNAVDCTTHYRTDLQVYNTREDCEKATQPIMDDTLKQFKELGHPLVGDKIYSKKENRLFKSSFRKS